ncbi:MAG: 6-carboxytetrahydropterin synthase [Hyphomicrobiaceae bacterium]|nr:MAG: 6-carboxytetrahydropterin synthase [Hyphomicrobiaceae bacterium]
MRIYKDFRFEAAHFLPSETRSVNGRLHGHSFRARITIEGRIDPRTGCVMHFDALTAAMAEARDALDHRLLNEIDGLATPTLEHISIWLWNRLQNRVPGLAEIEIARDSCQEGCVYRGPGTVARQAAE